MDGTRPPVGPDLCTVDPMRTRIVRTLSAGAVLVTAAGITIGSQGLGSPPVSASASSSSTPTTTPGAGSAASSVPVTAAVTPVPGTTTQFSYVAGDAATVVVDSAGGVLRIVTFTPHPGWFTLRLDQPNMTQFEVRLESSTGQVRFAAALVDGAIVPQLEVGTAPSGSVPDTAPGNSGPGNSAPDNSAPGNSAPGNSAGLGTAHRATQRPMVTTTAVTTTVGTTTAVRAGAATTRVATTTAAQAAGTTAEPSALPAGGRPMAEHGSRRRRRTRTEGGDDVRRRSCLRR